MLKKAGILVAATAAGILAITPLAFATGDGHHDSDHGSDHVTYSNVEEGNLTNDCEFGQEGPNVAQELTGGSGLISAANPVTGLVAPITAQTQLLNCNNIGVSDVIDSNSNNTDSTDTRTRVDGSFNTED